MKKWLIAIMFSLPLIARAGIIKPCEQLVVTAEVMASILELQPSQPQTTDRITMLRSILPDLLQRQEALEKLVGEKEKYAEMAKKMAIECRQKYDSLEAPEWSSVSEIQPLPEICWQFIKRTKQAAKDIEEHRDDLSLESRQIDKAIRRLRHFSADIIFDWFLRRGYCQTQDWDCKQYLMETENSCAAYLKLAEDGIADIFSKRKMHTAH